MSRASPSPSGFPPAFVTPALVTLSGVTARTPDGTPLFDDLSFAFGRERTGLVGRNGVGKTTLLRLIAGLDAPSEGAVARVGEVGWLAQRHDPEPDETVAVTLGVGEPLAVLARVLAGEGAADDLDAADWTLEARLGEALAQAGLAGIALDRMTRSLSGGERTRLRLAGLAIAGPELIVLDEPTNDLDAEARAKVAQMLGGWKGGVVVVSHDRDLLRRMDRIVEMTSLGVATYGGGYDLYAERKAMEREAAARDLASAERDAARVDREVQKARESKDRRDRAGRAFRAKGAEPKMFLDMEAERAEASAARGGRLAERRRDEAATALGEARERVERTRPLVVPMPATGLAAGRTVLKVEDACWDAPDGRRLVGPVSMALTGPERVAITGPNGAGKTTLLKLIAGELEPSSGRVERPVEAVVMDQAVAMLRPEETLLEAFRRLDPTASVQEAHAALARFLFRNAAAQRMVGTLSGGERLRAGLACVMGGSRPPQLLVLDEPTNHLDLDAILAVEQALAGYDGALIVVSHDAAFVEAVGVERTVTL